MLTLPPFELHSPTTVAEAVALLAKHKGEAQVLAGGTDLVPNMKHRVQTPQHVVALKHIRGLDGVIEEGGVLRIGALCRLAPLSEHPTIRARLPALAEAAGQVAGPQLREMGTLGGNLCLDTRCVYYNQTYFWRKALGFCLKKDGTVCHVVESGRKCVAAASNDTAPVLMSLGAIVRLMGPSGERDVPLDRFYVPDGIRNTVVAPDELLVEARVPVPASNVRMGYQKLRIRASIDYPALLVAVASAQDAQQTLEWIRIVVSALGARPHAVGRLDGFAGRKWDGALVRELALHCHKQCHPLTNINVDAGWRREMVPVLVRRALEQAQTRT